MHIHQTNPETPSLIGFDELVVPNTGYTLTRSLPIYNPTANELFPKNSLRVNVDETLTFATPGADTGFFLGINLSLVPALLNIVITISAPVPNVKTLQFLLRERFNLVSFLEEDTVDQVIFNVNSDNSGKLNRLNYFASTGPGAILADVSPGGSGSGTIISNFKDLINLWIQNNNQANNVQFVPDVVRRPLGPNPLP